MTLAVATVVVVDGDEYGFGHRCRLDDRWQVALNLNNLTDRVYYQTVGEPEEDNYYGEPRNFTLSLRGSF